MHPPGHAGHWCISTPMGTAQTQWRNLINRINPYAGNTPGWSNIHFTELIPNIPQTELQQKTDYCKLSFKLSSFSKQTPNDRFVSKIETNWYREGCVNMGRSRSKANSRLRTQERQLIYCTLGSRNSPFVIQQTNCVKWAESVKIQRESSIIETNIDLAKKTWAIASTTFWVRCGRTGPAAF